jgi:uncharacterized membrane protein
MTQEPAVAHLYAAPILPSVRKISIGDLKDALAKGWDDFMHKPSHILILAIVYPLIGLILFRLTFGHHLLPLLFPLAAGFALLGPFAALGFYEVSRQREQGRDPSWWEIIGSVSRHSRSAILILGALLMVIFFGWIMTAEYIFEAIFGQQPPSSLSGFIDEVFETQGGVKLILIGNFVGFLFALVCFTISVVAFPLVLDRDVSAPAAIVTSVKAVLANPVTMLAWAIFVVATLIAGSLPLLLGLVIVLPVLGHATWHLYRKVVV